MKYKAIRSAARNFGASFVSAVNWIQDDYVMSHLARRVVTTKSIEFTLDLLTGQPGPPPLVTPAIADAAADSARRFGEICAGERVDVDCLLGAWLRIRFELEGTAAATGTSPPWSLPFRCLVSVRDDRGKEHESLVEDVWRVSTSHPVVGKRPY